MTDDLISRQAVFDWFCESADIDGCVDLPKNNGSCKKGCRYCIGGEELDEIPTADVRENVHARWLPYEFGTKRWHICSACGIADEYINEKGLEAVRRFCPFCGAQMDTSDFVKEET